MNRTIKAELKMQRILTFISIRVLLRRMFKNLTLQKNESDCWINCRSDHEKCDKSHLRKIVALARLVLLPATSKLQ